MYYLRLFLVILIVFTTCQYGYSQEKRFDYYLRFVFLNAIYEKNLEEVQQYLDKGADPDAYDAQGISALMYAVMSENQEIVKLLLQQDINIHARDYNGLNALMYAVSANNDTIIDIILQQEPDINAQTYAGETALLFAAQTGNLKVGEWLIERGALVDQPDNNGITPLMYAVAFGHFFFTDLLLFHGADVNATTPDNSTAMHLAAWYGHNEIMGLLLDSGADLDSKDKKGNTPIMVAIHAQNLQATWYLIESGANLEIKNRDGFTPLALAAGLNDTEMVKFIASYEFEEKETHKNRSALAMAYYWNNKQLVDFFINGYNPKGLYISGFLLETGMNFNKNDLMYGFSAGLYEARYRMVGKTSFYRRFQPRPVYMLQLNDIIYRYLEQRSMWVLSLQRDFTLLGSEIRKIGALAGLATYYTYGNYKGTANKPPSGIKISPLIDLYFKSNWFTIFGSYSFVRTGVSEIPANRYQAGVRIHMSLYSVENIRYNPVIR